MHHKRKLTHLLNSAGLPSEIHTRHSYDFFIYTEIIRASIDLFPKFQQYFSNKNMPTW
jgi:hypothetical protein